MSYVSLFQYIMDKNDARTILSRLLCLPDKVFKLFLRNSSHEAISNKQFSIDILSLSKIWNTKRMFLVLSQMTIPLLICMIRNIKVFVSKFSTTIHLNFLQYYINIPSIVLTHYIFDSVMMHLKTLSIIVFLQ